MIALASKCYYLAPPEEEGKPKFSCKSVNRRNIAMEGFGIRDVYANALFQQKEGFVENMGFRARENKIFSYTALRKGFGYLYVKRYVHSNGIDTSPLMSILNPWNIENLFVLDKQNCLSNEFETSLSRHNFFFNSCWHLYYFEMAKFHNMEELSLEIAQSKHSAAEYLSKKINQNSDWYKASAEIMNSILLLKMQSIGELVISTLRTIGDKPIIHPGSRYSRKWSSGISKQLSKISNRTDMIGENYLGLFWDARNKELQSLETQLNAMNE